jgi:hypothetical protein
MRNKFISVANKRVKSTVAESPTLESSNGSSSDVSETYPAEGPGPSQDEPVISPARSVATSSLHHDSEVPDILEERGTSAGGLAPPSKKRKRRSEKKRRKESKKKCRKESKETGF